MMETAESNEVLKDLGIENIDRLIEIDEALTKMNLREGRSPLICLCGNPMHRHHPIDGFDGMYECRNGKSVTSCESPVAVLEVSYIKAFNRRTSGPGENHALLRGLSAMYREARKNDIEVHVRWVIKPHCVVCGQNAGEGIPILPVAITADNPPKVSHRPSPKNIFACDNCIATRLR
jgi:hypothetical protein